MRVLFARDQISAELYWRRWNRYRLAGRLVGRHGCGGWTRAIGTALVHRLAPFGPWLPGVLSRADAVVCCAMLHDGNAGLFGAAEFAAMKPGALFVNVARGGLVNEDALLDALAAGQVAGAGLDVLQREHAEPYSALIRHPRGSRHPARRLAHLADVPRDRCGLRG